MQQLRQQSKVVIVGAGRTGLALARHYRLRGAAVTLSDRRPAAAIGDLAEFTALEVACDLGGHRPEIFAAADLIVLSPGVPSDLPALQAARQVGVPVLGEIEVAFRDLAAPLVAVTGTNGKSTTTCLLGEIFTAWGRRTFVGGNLGTPLVEAVAEGPWDYLVAEVSSFQLETIDTFRPRYALLLNISEDHLDRYADMNGYLAAKARVFENMTRADVAVLNAEDPVVLALAAATLPAQILFSSRRLLEEGMGFDNGDIVWRHDGHEVRFPSAELQLRGTHNVENVMAALIPPLLEGCPPQTAWQAVCAFAGLPHRMRLVRTLDGVAWYDDSKGTNVGSVVKSLAGLAAPVTLIAGGKDKGGDYTPLVAPVRAKVTHLILIGEATERMAAALGRATTVTRAASLEEAVALAHAHTAPGGAVLLSPACSSFDMFTSYAHRGEVFARAVLALPEREAV